ARPSALGERHVVGVFEVGGPNDARLTVPASQCVRDRVPVKQENALPSAPEFGGGGKAHDAAADNDDVVCHGLAPGYSRLGKQGRIERFLEGRLVEKPFLAHY